MDGEELYEVRFVPEDDRAVDLMFKAFSDAAEMNPGELEEDEGEFMFDRKEVLLGSKENDLENPEGKFSKNE